MSHFTVMVLGDTPEDSLAPYQENNMGDCPEEYLEFDDQTEEYMERYKNEAFPMVVTPEGERISRYGDEFSNAIKEFLAETNGELPSFVTHEFREQAWEGLKEQGWEEIDVPYTEFYDSFEEYIEDRCNSEEVDGETRYGYWHNPNSKWDWYVLGGRWKGMLKLKHGAKGTEGEPGVFGNSSRPGWVDQARKGDIDWQGMRMVKKAAAMKRYDKFEAKVKAGYKPEDMVHFIKWWADNKYPNDRYPHKPQDEYQNMDAFLADKWRHKCAETTGIIDFIGPRTIPSREDYVKKSQDFSTFAVIDLDGQWHEAGKMGWWGMVDATEEEQQAFSSGFFERWIEPLDDDVLISIYDCHV